MDWDQIAESLKQLRSKIVSVRNAATGRSANRDLSMGGTASYDHEQMTCQAATQTAPRGYMRRVLRPNHPRKRQAFDLIASS